MSERATDYLCLLRPADSVAVARRALVAGLELDGGGIHIRISAAIHPGHKVAVKSIERGGRVIKYGQVIGLAREEIGPGDHVHTHNLEVREFNRDYEFCVEARPVEYYPEPQRRTFQGYARPSGRVGTRNYIAVISSVNCSASVSQYVAERFRGSDFRREHPEVDGVVAFTHASGCAIDPGEPQRVLQRVLAGMARHPNIAGYALIGLGCEVNQIKSLVENHHLDRLRDGELAPAVMNIQQVGGVRKTVEAGVQAVSRLLPRMQAIKRTSQPASKLILGLNCGGSDGNSGITANPALGVASDELVRHGGTSVLAETPEIYGAEHLLTRRAATREVGEKLIRLIHWWEDYVRKHGTTIDNNPSFGNIQGGLTTIFEKSLGAIAKGGQSRLEEVYQYAEPIEHKGLCFMDTPGFDPVSMTGLVAGGCNVAVFTTGRGSVYGCKPTPCIKVSTHTPLFKHMEEDMDLNAGTILDGSESVEEVGRRIFEMILAVASGERTKSELNGIGDQEFVPWHLGPVL